MHVVWKVAARNKLQSGSRPDPVRFFNQVIGFVCGYPIAGLDRSGHHPAHVRARCLCKEILSPLIEGNAPRIWDRKLGGTLQEMPLRGIPEKAAIGAPNRPIRSLHIGMQESSLAHVNSARRISTKCMDPMVRVVVVKTT